MKERDWILCSTAAYSATLENIVQNVCLEFGVTRAEIMGAARHSRVVVPRQVISWLAYKYSKLTLPAIGRIMDRDHTTILEGYRRTDQRIVNQKEFSDRVALLEARLRA